MEFRSKLGKEPKVASLWRMTGPTFAHDLPRTFFDPGHISMMIREIKRQHGESHSRDETAVRTSCTPLVASSAEPYAKGDSRATDVGSREREWASDTNLLHVRATVKAVNAFGPLVAVEEQRRVFHDAARQAFFGDGDHKNWTVHKLQFPDFYDAAFRNPTADQNPELANTTRSKPADSIIWRI